MGGFHLKGVNKFMNTYVLNPVMRTIFKNDPAFLSSDLCLKHIYINGYLFKCKKKKKNINSAIY
jgi:hypothetical protein